MNPAVLVGVGGVVGAIARHALGERIDTRTRDTLAVNVVGSLLLGVLVAAPPSAIPVWVQLSVGTGFCGAFTTFSTFAFETVRLAEEDEVRGAATNALTNLVGALGAVAVGAWIATVLW